MCEIIRAEAGTVVGTINDFSNLQVYKPQIQRISWVGRDPHESSKSNSWPCTGTAPRITHTDTFTWHGLTQCEKTASENFQAYVHRSGNFQRSGYNTALGSSQGSMGSWFLYAFICTLPIFSWVPDEPINLHMRVCRIKLFISLL